MIHPQSASYPYLAVAQLYGVPYADVLQLADRFDDVEISYKAGMQLSTVAAWAQATLEAWGREQQRRRKGV